MVKCEDEMKIWNSSEIMNRRDSPATGHGRIPLQSYLSRTKDPNPTYFYGRCARKSRARGGETIIDGWGDWEWGKPGRSLNSSFSYDTYRHLRIDLIHHHFFAVDGWIHLRSYIAIATKSVSEVVLFAAQLASASTLFMKGSQLRNVFMYKKLR